MKRFLILAACALAGLGALAAYSVRRAVRDSLRVRGIYDKLIDP